MLHRLPSKAAALDLIGQIGYEPDHSLVESHWGRAADGSRAREVVARDQSGDVDFHILIRQRPHKDMPEVPMVDAHETDARFGHFNGLLARNWGEYNVGKHRRAYVSVLSSLTAINALQVKLGRRPGIDAYEFVEGNGKEYTADIWIPHLARMQIPVASRRHQEQRTHDLNTGDHLGEHIIRSVLLGTSIRDQAIHRTSIYRDQFLAGERPHEARVFTKAEDYISTFIRKLANQTLDLAREGGLTEAGLRRRLKRLQHVGSTPVSHDELAGFGKHAINLGLVSPKPSPAQADIIRTLYLSNAGSAAAALLRTEEIKERSLDTPRAREQRMAAFSMIAEAFPDAA